MDKVDKVDNRNAGYRRKSYPTFPTSIIFIQLSNSKLSNFLNPVIQVVFWAFFSTNIIYHSCL